MSMSQCRSMELMMSRKMRLSVPLDIDSDGWPDLVWT
jgi:hypothetical protein